MTLTGPVFLWSLGCATLLVFFLVVWHLPRVSGRGVRFALARALHLAVVNALVILTAAVALNRQFTFFADWTDLRGALSGSAPQTRTAVAGANAAQAARAAVGGMSAVARRSRQALPRGPGGDRVLRFTLTGHLSGIRDTVLVRLPAGYAAPENRARRYPVLQTFSGYPGGPEQWLDSMNLGGAIDAAVDRRHMGQVITVSANVEVPPHVDTECVNGSGGDPQVETWVSHDVPTWVRTNFRVLPNRDAWATIGLSAGGWCAAMITMLHPAQYSAAIVLGGYFAPDFSPGYRPFRPTSVAADRYDLIALARHRPPPVALWVQTSYSDPVSYSSSARLLAAATSPMSVHAVVLNHAGHRISLWKALLPDTLSWLGTNIPGFAPASPLRHGSDLAAGVRWRRR